MLGLARANCLLIGKNIGLPVSKEQLTIPFCKNYVATQICAPNNFSDY